MRRTRTQTYKAHLHIQQTNSTGSKHLDVLAWLFIPYPKDPTLLQMAWVIIYTNPKQQSKKYE